MAFMHIEHFRAPVDFNQMPGYRHTDAPYAPYPPARKPPKPGKAKPPTSTFLTSLLNERDYFNLLALDCLWPGRIVYGRGHRQEAIPYLLLETHKFEGVTFWICLAGSRSKNDKKFVVLEARTARSLTRDTNKKAVVSELKAIVARNGADLQGKLNAHEAYDQATLKQDFANFYGVQDALA